MVTGGWLFCTFIAAILALLSENDNAISRLKQRHFDANFPATPNRWAAAGRVG
jgi:hypothetical protein